MHKVLVTGGSGFLGSFLVERLVRDGHQVRVFDNNFRGRSAYLETVHDKIELVTGDITDASQVKAAVKHVDTVFHLAAINGTRFFYEIPETVLNVNMKGTMNVLEALSKSVRKFVFFSSSETYGTPEHYPTDEDHKLVVEDPSNPRFTYSGSKILGEIYTHVVCKKLGIDYALVRPHNIYGPRMGHEHVIPQFFDRIINNEEFVVQGDGSQTRSFCYVTDAVDCIVKVAQARTNGQPFNVGNDEEEVTVAQLIQRIAKVTHTTIQPKFGALLKGSTPRRLPSIQRARTLLGYEPKVSLDEGLRLTFDWYKKAAIVPT